MKPSSIARRGYTKDSLPLASQFPQLRPAQAAPWTAHPAPPYVAGPP